MLSAWGFPRRSTQSGKFLMRAGAVPPAALLPCLLQICSSISSFCNLSLGTDTSAVTVACDPSRHSGPSAPAGVAVYYTNCRSLLPKMDELRHLAIDSRPDIIALTETWLDSDISVSEISIASYQLFRRDRTWHGGGIALYVSESIQVKSCCCADSLEFMSVVFATASGSTLLVCTIARRAQVHLWMSLSLPSSS